MAQQYSHTFGPHYGGMSEDDYLTRKGEVLYCENVDILSNSKFITLSQKVGVISPTATGKIIKMFYDSRVGLIFSDENNFVFKKDDAGIVWDAGSEVEGYWIAHEYLYMITQDKDIHRILVSDTTNSSWSSYITETDTSLPSDGSRIVILAQEDITYIGYGQNLYIIDNATGTVDATGTYEFLSDDIVGMTYYSDTVKIYQANGEVFYWRGLGEETFVESGMLGVGVQHIFQDGSVEYAIVAGRLAQIQGFSISELFLDYYSDELNSDKIRIDYGAMVNSGQPFSVINGVFYIAGDNSGINLSDGTTNYGGEGILTFGSKKTTIQTGFSLLTTKTNDEKTIAEVHAIVKSQGKNSSNDFIYFGYEDSQGLYKVGSIETSDGFHLTQPAAEGIVIYPVFDGGEPSREKKMVSLELRSDLPTNDCTIELFTIDKNDDNTNMIPFNDTSGSNIVTGPKSHWRKTYNNSFYETTLAIRIKDDRNVNRDAATRHYSIRIVYEYVNQ